MRIHVECFCVESASLSLCFMCQLVLMFGFTLTLDWTSHTHYIYKQQSSVQVCVLWAPSTVLHRIRTETKTWHRSVKLPRPSGRAGCPPGPGSVDRSQDRGDGPSEMYEMFCVNRQKSSNTEKKYIIIMRIIRNSLFQRLARLYTDHSLIWICSSWSVYVHEGKRVYKISTVTIQYKI